MALRSIDLMVGDWIMFQHGIDKIVDLPYIEGRGLCASFAASATLFPVPIEQLKPIPLTSEILEKNGFECNLNTKTFYRILSNEPKLVVEVRLWDKDTNVRIGKQCDGTFRVGYDWFINGLTITNVHELQHALRLCGIDKEIEL